MRSSDYIDHKMEDQFENCSKFHYHQLKMLNLTMCLTGAGGMIVAGLTFTILLCIRAYKTVLQRLFLYGVVSTFVHEATHFANMEHQFSYRSRMQKQVCEHLGFLVNWTTWIICNFHMCIVAYLLFVVFTQVRGDPFPRLAHLKVVRRALEVACVLLSIFLPVTVLWAPYLSHEYGLDESWCWMRAFDSNCTSAGLSYKLIYGYSYFEAVGLIALLTAVGITIVYCKLATRFSNAKQLLRQVMILVLSIVAFMIILNIMLGIDALSGSKSSYTRQIFFSAAATINDLIFLGGYIFTFYFPKCPTCAKRKSTSQKHNKVEGKNEKDYGTFGQSDRVSAPSSTEFHIQYTGEFTSITRDKNLVEN